ncbi:MAG: UdgX family uracil-DNA binding protein [Acidobacteriota bacterium]|nr:UdgX family uracil-DNA binding protein [Acidobacteriota bacterium]
MTIATAASYQDWRDKARIYLRNRVSPGQLMWRDAHDDQTALEGLFDTASRPAAAGPAPRVPKKFIELAGAVACFRDPERWNLLYRVVYRLTHGAPHLLEIEVDDDIRKLLLMAKSVGRDIHKMTAFVRFRRIERDGAEEFVAWHRPDHLIVDRAAPFFVRRFGSMRWAILTPDRSAYFDTEQLRFGPGLPRSEAPQADVLEDLWRAYYASMFNPARVKVKAMKAEMPIRHWATLPEAQLIPDLLGAADRRVTHMSEKQPTSARLFIPPDAEIDELRSAASQCRACRLCEQATQTVFGEGPANARVMMVGEQPGDHEDLQGRPFVGPAGQLLDRALRDAEIDRAALYMTNAVKHFKFHRDGKRRIHEKPRGVEIAACKPWLDAEISAVRPELLVCLGSTAAQSLIGRDFQVTRERGVFFPRASGQTLLATIHPSAILRMPDAARKEDEYRQFVEDLKSVKQRMTTSQRLPSGPQIPG